MSYKFNPFTSNFDLVNDPVSSGDPFNTQYFTLSGTDITNKYVLLSTAPVTKNKTVMLPEGPAQTYGVDFEVTNDNGGTRLSWNGLALDGVLEAGDLLLILYS